MTPIKFSDLDGLTFNGPPMMAELVDTRTCILAGFPEGTSVEVTLAVANKIDHVKIHIRPRDGAWVTRYYVIGKGA